MAEVDVRSSVAGGTADDQKKQGTHPEHSAKLSSRFAELIKNGAATPERYKELCFTLLKSFEATRVDQERQIKDYEAKIAYCRATQSSCSMFSNLLIGILAKQVQESGRALAGEIRPKPQVGVMTDTEMLQRICICGCVDDDDAANCKCSCHSGVPCGDERCVVCKAQRALETSGRRSHQQVDQKQKKKKKPKKVQ